MKEYIAALVKFETSGDGISPSLHNDMLDAFFAMSEEERKQADKLVHAMLRTHQINMR